MVRQYNNINKEISIQISDKEAMFVNERKEGLRGYESPMFLLRKENIEQRKDFENYMTFFEELWNNKNTSEVFIQSDQWIKDLIASTDVDYDVLETTLKIAQEIAREGHEGRHIGTSFFIGDSKKLLKHSNQLILNPFKGHSKEKRNIKSLELRETIKEFAQIDGAFIISGEGVIEAAGREMKGKQSDKTTPSGKGTRHSSAKSITKDTNSVGIVVSQSGGKISIFKKGDLFRQIDRME